MVREEFIRHAERHIQDRPGLNQPAGSFDFRAESSPSPPPTPRLPREPPRRAAPQWRRFRQGSVPEDAGGPSAFDFNEPVHRYIDYHNYSDYSNYSLLQGGQA